MSYLDTMYEGLFKEAAPWGNTVGNMFSNQDNGAAPVKQPESTKPTAVPAAQQTGQTSTQSAPRAMTWMEQQQQKNPAPQQNSMSPAPRAMTAAEQEQLNPKPTAIDLYAGMPQTQEDWQRNLAANHQLYPDEVPIGGTGDEEATLAPNQQYEINAVTGKPYIVEYADRDVAPAQRRPTEAQIAEQRAKADAATNATVPAQAEEVQPSQPYMPAPNSQDEADMQAKADAITIQSQLGALNLEEDAARIGIDPLYLQNILNRNNLTPEQKLEAYRRYVYNAENKALTVNETMPAAIASNSLTQAEVNDNTFKQTTGRDASLSEFINTYGADADLPSRFKPAMIPGTDSMVRNDLMNISTEETLQVLDDLKDNPAGIDKALEAIGSCKGIDPAFIRSEQFQSLTPDQQATYALAAVERSVMTGTDLGDKINGFLSKGDTKTNVFDTYMKTQNGQKQVKAMIDALPPQLQLVFISSISSASSKSLFEAGNSFVLKSVLNP